MPVAQPLEPYGTPPAELVVRLSPARNRAEEILFARIASIVEQAADWHALAKRAPLNDCLIYQELARRHETEARPLASAVLVYREESAV